MTTKKRMVDAFGDVVGVVAFHALANFPAKFIFALDDNQLTIWSKEGDKVRPLLFSNAGGSSTTGDVLGVNMPIRSRWNRETEYVDDFECGQMNENKYKKLVKRAGVLWVAIRDKKDAPEPYIFLRRVGDQFVVVMSNE